MEHKCSLILASLLFQIYYFLKLSFPICQVHFAKMLDSQFHIAKSSTPHCLYYVGNSTLTHSQLHIAKSSTSHCQIVNSTLQVIHCQLAKLTSFSGLPPFFTLTPKKFNILPNAYNSFLGCPNKIFWDLFSTHLPSASTSYPPRLPTQQPT
jgi:hypothetical protein